MNVNICPTCSKGTLTLKVSPVSSPYIGRDGIERILEVPEVPQLVCDVCHEVILDDVAVRKIEEAQRSAVGLLTGDEIRDLRAQFGKNQVQMSKLLGVGEKTYCRWESGASVQTVAFDNYLRIVRSLPEAAWILSLLEARAEALEDSNTTVESQFPSLPDISSLRESGERFTRELVGGRLHVSDDFELSVRH
jgi:HTH-type transcriptional regulator/antitoxin MqsA